MIYNPTKIEPIFNYYFNFGFGHSLQKIADTISVTKKTLFNRYQNKENMERCVVDYWQLKSCERLKCRVEFANNAVEKLMMFLFELQYCRNNETHFFQKTKELFLEKIERDSPYINQIEEILKSGIEDKCFIFENEPKLFAYFFQFNAFYILLNHNSVITDYIPFIFYSILADEGKALYKDIDIEQVFKL